jgi:60 kDa SS-A/Ro ribonucleoprotein
MRSVSMRVAAKLRDPQAMAAARVMPYQLMATYNATDQALPAEVRDALQDALEIALSNVPAFAGHVVVCPDASSSMSAPVTGQRGSATTKIRCSAVAAMLSAAILHKNRFTRVLPFGTEVLPVSLNPRDSVLTNAKVLAALQGGGTNCSAPLALLNIEDATVDLVIIVSDNESWMDPKHGRGTRTMLEWEALKARNPHARLVCIDLQPYDTTQAVERTDILNVGGFSDAVFDTIARFVAGTIAADHWVGEIEKVSLEVQ